VSWGGGGRRQGAGLFVREVRGGGGSNKLGIERQRAINAQGGADSSTLQRDDAVSLVPTYGQTRPRAASGPGTRSSGGPSVQSSVCRRRAGALTLGSGLGRQTSRDRQKPGRVVQGGVTINARRSANGHWPLQTSSCSRPADRGSALECEYVAPATLQRLVDGEAEAGP